MEQISSQTEKISSYETSRTRLSLVDDSNSNNSNNDEDYALSGFYVREKNADKPQTVTDSTEEDMGKENMNDDSTKTTETDEAFEDENSQSTSNNLDEIMVNGNEMDSKSHEKDVIKDKQENKTDDNVDASERTESKNQNDNSNDEIQLDEPNIDKTQTESSNDKTKEDKSDVEEDNDNEKAECSNDKTKKDKSDVEQDDNVKAESSNTESGKDKSDVEEDNDNEETECSNNETRKDKSDVEEDNENVVSKSPNEIKENDETDTLKELSSNKEKEASDTNISESEKVKDDEFKGNNATLESEVTSGSSKSDGDIKEKSDKSNVDLVETTVNSDSLKENTLLKCTESIDDVSDTETSTKQDKTLQDTEKDSTENERILESILKEQLEKPLPEQEDEMDEDFDPSLLCPDISMDVDESNVITNDGTNDGAISPLPYEPIFSELVDEMTGTEVQVDLTPQEMEIRMRSFGPNNKVEYSKIHCTACNVHLGSALIGANNRFVHPLLKVLICKDCYHFYTSGEFEKDEDGSELYCRWCGQGGQVLCCSSCEYVFCKRCIRNNFGPRKFKEIRDSEDWNCFRCNPQQLSFLRAACAEFMDYYRTTLARVQNLTDQPELMTIDYTRCCNPVQSKTDEAKTVQAPKTQRRKRKDSNDDPDYKPIVIEEEPPKKKPATETPSIPASFTMVTTSSLTPATQGTVLKPGMRQIILQSSQKPQLHKQIIKIGPEIKGKSIIPGQRVAVQRTIQNQPGSSFIKILPQGQGQRIMPVQTVLADVSSKGRTLSLQEKIEILEVHSKDKLSLRGLSKRFNIGESQASSIVKNKRELLRKWHSSMKSASSTIYSDLIVNQVDAGCYKWAVNLAREGKTQLTGAQIQAKAKEIATGLGYVNFDVSAGWLENFRLKHVPLIGEICDTGNDASRKDTIVFKLNLPTGGLNIAKTGTNNPVITTVGPGPKTPKPNVNGNQMKHDWFEKTVRASARVNSNLSYTLTQLNRQQSQATNVESLAVVHNKLQEILSTSINCLIQIRKNLRTEFIAGIKNIKFPAKSTGSVPIVVKDDDDVIFVNPGASPAIITNNLSTPPPLIFAPGITVSKKTTPAKNSVTEPQPSSSLSTPTTSNAPVTVPKGGFLKVRSFSALQKVTSECITIPDDPPEPVIPSDAREAQSAIITLAEEDVGPSNTTPHGKVGLITVYNVKESPTPEVQKMMSAVVVVERSAKVDELTAAMNSKFRMEPEEDIITIDP